MNTISVDAYLADGCGRCTRYQTPECKVHRWTEPLQALRAMLLASELTETMKWGCPCYTLDGKNVLMLTSLNDCCAISFFKGAALPDPDGLLVKAGPHSRIGRLLKFTSVQQVQALRPRTERLVAAAIEAERAGAKVVLDDAPEPIPDELAERLEAEPALRVAFDKLTPGRQRSHILHVSGAKQAATRARRVDKCVPKILAGRGFHDR